MYTSVDIADRSRVQGLGIGSSRDITGCSRRMLSVGMWRVFGALKTIVCLYVGIFSLVL